jgi:hypothetical protein
MRAEDRKPSKRVFPLLQNVDLDSVTFANVQGVGDPISIEDMNEQEMQDLVLVNLARLAVSGEWTGLLEAGGGSGGLSIAQGTYSSEYYNEISGTPPWGTMKMSSDFIGGQYRLFWPFNSPNTGDLSEIAHWVNTAVAGTSVAYGFYEVGDDGLPSTYLGSGSLASDSTGLQTTTSFTATISLEAGTNYFYCALLSAVHAGGPVIRTSGQDVPGIGPTLNLANTGYNCWRNSATSHATYVPSSDDSNSYPTQINRVRLGVKF